MWFRHSILMCVSMVGHACKGLHSFASALLQSCDRSTSIPKDLRSVGAARHDAMLGKGSPMTQVDQMDVFGLLIAELTVSGSSVSTHARRLHANCMKVGCGFDVCSHMHRTVWGDVRSSQ
jgi:hypothetical protein